MKNQTKLFEKQFLKARDAIERKGVAMAKKMIAEHYRYFMVRFSQVGIGGYQTIEIPEIITERFFKLYYPMAAPLAVMTYENLEKQASKKTEPDFKKKLTNSIFQSKLTEIVNTTAGEKITTITHTSVERIKDVIRGVLDEADTNGWGIPETTSNIFKTVGSNLRSNGYARARSIAQTELISASNQAAAYAAEKISSDYGLKYKNFWSTSGLERTRESHLFAERYSDDKDGLDPDEQFPMGDGSYLRFPGDPDGEAQHTINCRCSLLTEIVI